MAAVVLPGLIDAHVHLREPGADQKEDVASGTMAALAGGIVGVLDMPNNTPPIVDGLRLAQKRAIFRERARCDYGLFLGAGEEAIPGGDDARSAVGLKLYLTPTFGPLRLQSLGALLAIFRRWPAHKPVAVHAEGSSVAIPILLAQMTGRRVHVCHVARADEMALVRAAKEHGAPVTCEVTPHHLLLTRQDAERLGPFGQMKPALGEAEDVDALWRNLDVVDLVASDHAPHTAAEKRAADPPPGVPGVETMLPLLLTAVHEGRLSLDRVVDLLHRGPQRVYGVRAPEATVEVEIGGSWQVRGATLHSKCGWTPYEGRRVQARVRRVVLRGCTVFKDGRGLGRPGFGRELEPLA
ncbi:MAG: amidohydrolase family protein [Anaerolineae bacterium]|nr:amidohydrolase family protein [Anaerolineae bacterium]